MRPKNSQTTTDYTTSARLASKVLTQTFSSSFGSAITLFDKAIQQDIYNIYGLVRVADEIVDTYQGKEAGQLLDAFEAEVYAALKRGFSSNIIIHAFIETAHQYNIGKELLEPFFVSMRIDIKPATFTQATYETYIYGSAEVVGLMCLRVFVKGDDKQYQDLADGAKALGAAFQKVNFLRDIHDDFALRGRYYFPYGSFENFDESIKARVIDDISNDFEVARSYIEQLPKAARGATKLAYTYYLALLEELSKQPAAKIAAQRFSVKRSIKLKIFLQGKLAAYAK